MIGKKHTVIHLQIAKYLNRLKCSSMSNSFIHMTVHHSLPTTPNPLSHFHFQVRFAAAVCLGYLTFNKTAGRALLVSCRNTPGLYEKITRNIGKNPKISKDFTEDIRCAKSVGIPCLRYVCMADVSIAWYYLIGRYKYVNCLLRRSVNHKLFS